MTVAYEAGVASSPADLLSKLAAFAASNGWTVSSPTLGQVFRNGDINIGVFAETDRIRLRGALSYDAGSAWNAQPGASPYQANVILGGGAYTAYHAFVGDEDGAEYLHCVVERSAGLFGYLIFGQLVKYGTYSGGVYVDYSYWRPTGSPNRLVERWHRIPCFAYSQIFDQANNQTGLGHLWVDYDSKTDNWQPMNTEHSVVADRIYGSLGMTSMYDALIVAVGPMKWNLRSPLFPLEYIAARPEGLRSAIGRIPHMRQVSMANYAPGDEISVGGETWKVFPPIARETTLASGVPSSYLWGCAHLMPGS